MPEPYCFGRDPREGRCRERRRKQTLVQMAVELASPRGELSRTEPRLDVGAEVEGRRASRHLPIQRLRMRPTRRNPGTHARAPSRDRQSDHRQHAQRRRTRPRRRRGDSMTRPSASSAHGRCGPSSVASSSHRATPTVRNDWHEHRPQRAREHRTSRPSSLDRLALRPHCRRQHPPTTSLARTRARMSAHALSANPPPRALQTCRWR